MKIFCFRYPEFFVTNILISLICVMTITLVFLNNIPVSLNTDNYYIDVVLSFLDEYGIAEIYDTLTVSDVIFDKNSHGFDSYFELQKYQGFDISSYVGTSLKKYSFGLSEIRGVECPDGYYVNVYLYGTDIIAAEIVCVALNGYMEGVIPER